MLVAQRFHPLWCPPEAAIVAGYDQGGHVLVGWSFFQQDPEFSAGLEFEPAGYFRKRDWITDVPPSMRGSLGDEFRASIEPV